LFDRGFGLTPHRGLDLAQLWIVETTRVDERELPSAPFGGRVDPISRRAGDVLDDRDALSDEAVEQGGLADVRPSDDRDHGPRHQGVRPGSGLLSRAPRSAPSPRAACLSAALL